MRIKFLVFSSFVLLCGFAFPQSQSNDYFFLFYNVENLFDIKDDPETADEEFTPVGERHWTYNRFKKKLLNISKVLLSASEWTPPHIIALCEIENRYVLEKLIQDTPLKKYPYKIIHKESPDQRGIDVAFIYNSDVFYPLEYRFFSLINPEGSVQKSREILYVSGILKKTDTLHILVNHWPSRYSGLLESQDGRNLAAKTLNSCIDHIKGKYKNPKIIIAGDFNDQPTNESLYLSVGAKEPTLNLLNSNMYNLSLPWMQNDIKTLKHRSQWLVFDQIIVSGSLLNRQDILYTQPEWAQIVNLPFLTEKDEKYGGVRLNRTYNGYRYHGGFSDHLPVLLKIRMHL